MVPVTEEAADTAEVGEERLKTLDVLSGVEPSGSARNSAVDKQGLNELK